MSENNGNSKTGLAQTDAQAVLEQPAIFVNRVVIQSAGLVRLTFIESQGKENQRSRCAVMMLKQDAVEFHKLLGKLLDNQDSKIIRLK